jgi:hypothetical protein
LGDLWEYDIKNNKWKIYETKTKFPIYGHSLVYDKECDSFYIYGGKYKDLLNKEIYKFSFEKNEFEKLEVKNKTHLSVMLITKGQEQRPCTRCFHTMSLINNELFVFGGIDEFNNKLDDIWSYNLSTNMWKHIECVGMFSNPTPKVGHTSSILREDQMLVFGGESTTSHQLFDIHSKKWYPLKLDIDISIFSHTVDVVDLRNIIVIGGKKDKNVTIQNIFKLILPYKRSEVIYDIESYSKSIYEAYYESKLFDVVLKLDEETFNTHKCIISCSSYFKNLIDKLSTDEDTIVIDFFVKENILTYALEFIYGKTPTINNANEFMELYELSKNLNLKSIEEWCNFELTTKIINKTNYKIIKEEAIKFKNEIIVEFCSNIKSEILSLIGSNFTELNYEIDQEEIQRDKLPESNNQWESKNQKIIHNFGRDISITPTGALKTHMLSIRDQNGYKNFRIISKDGSIFIVDKFLLVSLFHFFSSMSNFSDDKDEIKFDEIDDKTISNFVHYCYTSTVLISMLEDEIMEDLIKLYFFADLISDNELKNACLKEAKNRISPFNSINILCFYYSRYSDFIEFDTVKKECFKKLLDIYSYEEVEGIIKELENNYLN